MWFDRVRIRNLKEAHMNPQLDEEEPPLETDEPIILVLDHNGVYHIILSEESEYSEKQINALRKISAIQEPSYFLAVVLWVEVCMNIAIDYISEKLGLWGDDNDD
jgi:hypothetical protein